MLLPHSLPLLRCRHSCSGDRFVTVTVVTLIATRPIVKKKLNTKTVKTNADRCIGQEGVVIEEINNLLPSGQVKVDGKVWTARSESPDVTIPKDSIVLIEKSTV